MKDRGVFDITTPKDLVEKAVSDIERLRANHLDTYAAFNFFITARHVPDWLHPDDQVKRDALFRKYVELRICRHLADGAKHFILTGRQHKQVRSTIRTHDAWGQSWRDSWGDSWGTNELMIDLDSADADTAKLGPKISALDLAEKVLEALRQIVP